MTIHYAAPIEELGAYHHENWHNNKNGMHNRTLCHPFFFEKEPHPNDDILPTAPLGLYILLIGLSIAVMHDPHPAHPMEILGNLGLIVWLDKIKHYIRSCRLLHQGKTHGELDYPLDLKQYRSL